MKNICAILGNVLSVTSDVVDCLTAISITFAELLSIYHRKIRGHIWVRMNPQINETIQLSDWIFALLRLLSSCLPIR